MLSIFACCRRLPVLAVALFLCGAAWAQPDPPGRVGRLAELRGTVWMYDQEQGEWVAAERNRPVTTGDRLSTDRDARAELRIGSATVRLDADTQVDVTALDDSHLGFELRNGSLAARLRSPEVAAQFTVSTADGRFQATRAGHYRIDLDDDVSTATVWSGELRFDASDSALTVPNGQSAEFWKEGGVTHYTWAGATSDTFSEWVLADDRRDEAAAPRYVSPEMTGHEDLDRYGRWETHPEYGALWIPVQVAPDWAPYRYGHWAWVRPWGWTWVDDAPWGFAPFHYGRWAWWNGRWGWAPGAYAARPVYAPALVGWVGGPSVNVSVRIGSGPVVGWVPLAPREAYHPWYPVGREHWRQVNPRVPDRFYRPVAPSRASALYANRGVPGGVTVVPADMLKHRQPIGNAVRSMDPRVAQQLVQQPAAPWSPPAPPAPVALRPAPVAPHGAAAGALGQVAPPPNRVVAPGVVDGRRGHGVIVPPPVRQQQQQQQQQQPLPSQQPPQPQQPSPAAVEVPSRWQGRRIVEPLRPAPMPPPPSPPEMRRPAPAPPAVREVPRAPAAAHELQRAAQQQPGRPAPQREAPPQREVPPQREAQPRESQPQRPPPAQPVAREEIGEGRRGSPHEGRGAYEGRPGGGRQQQIQ